jgi:hypothetical protein
VLHPLHTGVEIALMSDDEDWEEHPYFTGECTCDHDREEHGWGSCDVEIGEGEYCPCEAGWEE